MHRSELHPLTGVHRVASGLPGAPDPGGIHRSHPAPALERRSGIEVEPDLPPELALFPFLRWSCHLEDVQCPVF